MTIPKKMSEIVLTAYLPYYPVAILKVSITNNFLIKR